MTWEMPIIYLLLSFKKQVTKIAYVLQHHFVKKIYIWKNNTAEYIHEHVNRDYH